MADWTDAQPPLIRLPDLAGRSAVVTGASRGIGRAIIYSLLDNGVRCFGIADEADSQSENPLLTSIRCDLRDPDAIRAAVEEIRQHTPSLDYVVNVAGISPKFKIDEGGEAEWHQLMDLNLRAYYLMIRACLPLLREGRGKSIVNVGSINYRLGVIGRSIYSASKAGILGLTTGMARELGREGIRVNTISPGWVFTEREIDLYFGTEEGDKYLAYLADRQSILKKIQPSDIANHVLFYLSAVSGASTGHNCVVDAGWLLE